MKFFSVLNQINPPKFFLILTISINLLLFFNLGCRTKVNQINYNQCIYKIEEERKKVRWGNGFSYKAQSFEECRAPARYRLDSE